MNKNTIIFILLLLAQISKGQDTIYFDKEWNQVSSINNCTFYRIKLYDQADTNRRTEKIFFKSGQLKSQKNYNGKKIRWEGGGVE
jgi:periplasmic protein TonB